MTETINKLKKARINLSSRNPFFSFLSYNLKFEKMERKSEDEPGVAIDDNGVLYYDEDYINSLSQEQVLGVICHEVMHMSFLHLLRCRNRIKNKWDLATDICVNSILNENEFELPFGSIVPENNILEFADGFVLTDINKKTAEQIYAELPDSKKKDKQKGKGLGGMGGGFQGGKQPPSGKGKGKGKSKGESGSGQGDGRFDKHIENESQSESKRKQKENDWKQKVSTACIHSKQKGDIPLGIDRLYDELFKEQVDWRALLNRYLQRMMPVDYTWARPHKKSYSIKVYLPDIVREKIEVAVSIDSSGSISAKDLTDFVTEIQSITRAYKNRIDVTIMSHDVSVHNVQKFDAFEHDVVSKIKIKGGGGTSHVKIMKKLNEEAKPNSIVIFFTDGYSDLKDINFRKNKFNSIFVISEGGDASCLEGKKVPIIKLKGVEK